jgi:hypothetical protein
MSKSIQINDIQLMSKICQICYEDFTSHSFNYVCDTLEGGQIFYTQIASSSKYHDTAGIVAHCSNYLQHRNPQKWSWIIDFRDFGLTHMLGIKTGLKLTAVVNNFGRLHNLIVINSNTFVEQMFNFIKIVLDEKYHKAIQVIPSAELYKKKVSEWRPEKDPEHLLAMYESS